MDDKIMNLQNDLLANIIIEQYFLMTRCLILFTDDFSYSGPLPTIRIGVGNMSSANYDMAFRYFGCQGIVIKAGNPEEVFRNFEGEMKLRMDRFNDRRYLIIPTESDGTGIFETESTRFVADLVVMKEIDDGSVVNLWTHRYVGAEDNDHKMLLDMWYLNNQSFRYGNNLYPNKLLDQMGRVLEMATFQYEPYSILGDNIADFKGSEMSTAVLFSKTYNMTPVPRVIRYDEWGTIYENWTGNGLLGCLAADKADIGFAALYTWQEDYRYLDFSKPLVRTGITCLVPSPKLAAGWFTPLYSFSSTMWMAVGAMFLVSTGALFLMYYFQNRPAKTESKPQLLHKSYSTILKLFVLQTLAPAELPLVMSGTCFMGLMFLFELFLTATYSSGLAGIMTVPRYENPVDTVDDFYRSGLYWGATEKAWITSISGVEDAVYKEIVSRFVALPEEQLRENSKSRDFAFSLERLPHYNYAIGTYIQEDVIGNYHLMQEDLYWEQCIIMARKSSILMPLLDTFILRVFENGLISYWQNEAVGLYMNSHVQNAVKYYNLQRRNEDGVVKLTWTHVEGAFAILGMGYLFSSFVFLSEILYHRMASNKLHYSKYI